MVVNRVNSTEITCLVIHGGVLSNNKGINVPGVTLSMPYLSEKDRNDLEFGAKMGFDFIAASFVSTSADIDYLRKYTHSLGWFNVRIIAKIENLEGVKNIDEILESADGIMVARGDLGVEIPLDRKSTRLNSSHVKRSRMPSYACDYAFWGNSCWCLSGRSCSDNGFDCKDHRRQH